MFLPKKTSPDEIERMSREIEALRVAVAERDDQIGKLAELVRKAEQTIKRQQETIEDLVRRLYGRSSERLDPNQSLMDGVLIDGQSEVPAPDAPQVDPGQEKTEGKKKRPNHKGRRPLPEHLPREERIIEIPEEEKVCPESGMPRQFMGYEETEKLEYAPETLKVIVIKREKYGSPVGAEEEGVVIAERPESAVECMAETGMLAHVAVAKYEDHQPLYRLERVFAREGVHVSRKTMAGWLTKTAVAVTPIVDEMVRRILAGPVVHHDDTPVQMLDPGAGKTKKTRLWISVGGDHAQYVHFMFTTNRSKDGPVDFFRDYQGYLMGDQYPGYEQICKDEEVWRLSCWAHARRAFDKAKSTHPRDATEILTMIRTLYMIERDAKEMDPDERHRMRQERSVPQLERIRVRLEEMRPTFLPSDRMTKAINYVLERWESFTRYTCAPHLPIDNNVAERGIRSVAVGRKNWLFLGSENGGKTAAILMSLIGTTHRLGINAWAYLKDVLDRIPHTTDDQIASLLPDIWFENHPDAACRAHGPWDE
jgi:transposase